MIKGLPLQGAAALALLLAGLTTGACIPQDSDINGATPPASVAPPPVIAPPPAVVPPPVVVPPSIDPGPAAPPVVAPPVAPPGVAPPPPVGGNDDGNDDDDDDEEEALIVVGDVDNLGDGDEELEDLLEDLDFDTDTADDDDDADADDIEEDFAGVIISSSVNADVLGNEYENIEVPILVLDDETYPNMEMTGDVLNEDFGIANATEITFEEENHPIPEALDFEEDDDVEVADDNIAMSFGDAGNDAEILATVVDENNQGVLFEYEAGSDLDNDQEADEARIGFFANEQNIAQDLNGDGEDLLEATILYTLTGDAED